MRLPGWTAEARLAAVLSAPRGLSEQELDAVAALERRTVTADGGRLKLEWDTLRSRAGDRVEDLLWWDGERLLGFLALYSFAPPTVEIAGMVDPSARGRGIGTSLLDAGRELCAQRSSQRVLLVVPRPSEAGRRLAVQAGGRLDHSEHALLLTGPLHGPPPDPAVRLRPATVDDVPRLAAILNEAFGRGPSDLGVERVMADLGKRTVVEVDATVVGTLRASLDGDLGTIHGFAIESERRGRGIGRAALGHACGMLRADGARRISLEVEVDNQHALGLYTSLGFAPTVTEDYWALPVGKTAAAR
jgi:ribosomal protein S18 acetylase RimI-like enzyme